MHLISEKYINLYHVWILNSFVVLDKKDKSKTITQNRDEGEEEEEDLELPLFHMSTISIATDNFSVNNKLGEGGFGPVYRVSFSTSCLRILIKEQ